MKDRPFFAVIYMFAVTAFFSAVLIGFARLTRDRVDANQQLAFEKAVLDFERCLELYPDREQLYEMIYESRFQRLWEQFRQET